MAQLFIDFHTLVVANGVDPQVAHQAFLAIDEYAESICPGIEGAREPQTGTTRLTPRGERPVNRTDYKKQRMHGLPWTASSFAKPELKEWALSRKAAASAIDIETCELGRWAALDEDPYGLCEPGEVYEQFGTNRFVRSPDSRGWVHESDLPPEKFEAMYEGIRSQWAEEVERARYVIARNGGKILSVGTGHL